MATYNITAGQLKEGGILNSIEIPAIGGFTNIYSLSFDGVDDYVDCGTTLGAHLGSSYAGDQTVSLWYKRTSSRIETLFNIGNTAAYGNGASLIFINNNLICGLRYNNRAQFTTTFDTNWHHVLYSAKNNGDNTFNLKMYLDGTEVINTTVNIGYSALNFTGNTTQIGFSNIYEFKGNIDEVAYWDSDKSANVSTIYNSGNPSDLSSLNPLTYWRFEEGSGTTAIDNGSLGNNGTLINGVAYSTDVPS